MGEELLPEAKEFKFLGVLFTSDRKMCEITKTSLRILYDKFLIL